MAVEVPQDISLTILHRLEAATSRLEDMVPHISEPGVTNGVPGTDKGTASAGGVQGAESAVASAAPAAAPLPASIDDFDAMINGEVTTFVTKSEEIGGLLAEQVIEYRAGAPRVEAVLDLANDAGLSVRCPPASICRSKEISHCDHQS